MFNQTIKLIEKDKLSWTELQQLNDIDEPEDLIGTDLEKFLV